MRRLPYFEALVATWLFFVRVKVMQEKKRRTPREKKQLEYTKDFVNYAEYPQTFHKAWARKEARTHRAYRRKIHQLNSSLSTRNESNFPDWAEPGVIRLEQVEKWPVQPMGTIIT
ncbi:MAG: hypothetical protein ABIQ44_09425, partial [Chloroflexia bacterium]